MKTKYATIKLLTGEEIFAQVEEFVDGAEKHLVLMDPAIVKQLPAKFIKCYRGDTIIDCENGDITLRGRNINIEAVGGGQDGVININGNRIVDLNAPDIRLQAEKVLIDGKINVNIISNGFFQLRYGFALAAAEADMNFGAMAKVLEKATTIKPPNLSGYEGPKASKSN